MKKILIFVLGIMMLSWVYAHASSSTWPGDTSTANWSQSGSDLYYVGNVAVGDTNRYGALTVGGVSALKETVAPALQAGYGKLYVKSATHKIYFLTAGGVEYDLTAAAGSGAPTDATYLVMSAHAGLLDQRLLVNGAGITITDAGTPGGNVTVSIGNDAIKDSMVDWGAGAGQIDSDDVPEGGTNKYYTDAKARAAISNTATGLTYTSATGVLSLTAGHGIPTTTQISNWNNAYSHKTTEDAIVGLVACDGSGGYSGVTNGSTNWNDAYTKRVDTWTSPLSLVANVASIPKATAAVSGYLDSADFSTFASYSSKENALTFSTGLTRATNTITSDLSTGKTGGQTVIGGTQASENLRLQSTTHGTEGYVISDDNFLCDKAFGIAQIGGTAGKYASFQGGAMAADTLYTLPTAFPGANDYPLISSTAGVLSWNDQAVKSTSDVVFKSVQVGYNTVSGQVKLWAEQATDRTVTINPNTAMTSDANFYMPADEPASNDLPIIVSTGGVMSYNDQAVTTTSTPQLARLGLGGAADASAVMKATGQYYSAKCTDTVTTGAFTVDWNSGNVHYVVLDNGANTATFNNPKDGSRYLLIVMQPSSGAAGTISWPGTVAWPSGSAPTLTATNAKVDIVAFVYDGTNTKYYGSSSLNY